MPYDPSHPYNVLLLWLAWIIASILLALEGY